MLQAFVYFSALSLLRYVVFVGLAFAALWWLARRAAPWRLPLQAGALAPAQLPRELWLSAATILIGGAIAPFIIAMDWSSSMLFYRRIDEYGWAYFCFSILLMMLVRDALFYLFHRAMHHRRVFRFAHRAHHLSTNPDPWTAYAVHPVESLLDVVVTFLVILFFVPKHPLAYIIFLWIDAAYAVYGHMGVELYPRGFSRNWLGRWINTSVAHNHHHATARHNYGYYFLIWDRLLGTLDPDYDQRYELATRPRVAR